MRAAARPSAGSPHLAALPSFCAAPVHEEPDLSRRDLRAHRAVLGAAQPDPDPQPFRPALLAVHPARGAAPGELQEPRWSRARRRNPAGPERWPRPRHGRRGGPAAGREWDPPRLQPVRRPRGEPARLLAPVRHLHRLRSALADRAGDEAVLPLDRGQARGRSAGAAAVKHAALLALALLACAHAPAAKEPRAANLEVQDAVHGVRYALPAATETWQVTREGTARSPTGVETEVSSFPLAAPGTPQQCREYARARLSGKNAAPTDAGGASADAPREQASSDAPVVGWSFTSGAASAPVRNRWAFFTREADCLVLYVTGPKGDPFADQTFDTAARSFQVLPLPPERQRDVDLLAGMGFLERRDPASALERFEALTRREPDNAKAHFGALMAGFELGQEAYARALPHGRLALRSERDLTRLRVDSRPARRHLQTRQLRGHFHRITYMRPLAVRGKRRALQYQRQPLGDGLEVESRLGCAGHRDPTRKTKMDERQNSCIL